MSKQNGFLPLHRKVFIVAEAGVNHNGRLVLAKRLAEKAKWAGADAVKFQTLFADDLVTQEAKVANYQRKNIGKRKVASQYELLKSLELSFSEFRQLKLHCDKIGIRFFSTPFDYSSADFLYELGVFAFKIPSGEATNLPFINHIAKKGKPIFLSTGMCDISEVRSAVKAITKTGNKRITLLHCVSEYPAACEHVNLRAMNTLYRSLGFPVGFSDHTQGIEIATAATALGATTIEKHLTLNHGMAGPDHKVSLEPEQFKTMVESIRNVEKSLGSGKKMPTGGELKMRLAVRRSIVALRDLPKGNLIREGDLVMKRPGTGIPPKFLDEVIGMRTKRSICKDSLIQWDDLLCTKE